MWYCGWGVAEFSDSRRRQENGMRCVWMSRFEDWGGGGRRGDCAAGEKGRRTEERYRCFGEAYRSLAESTCSEKHMIAESAWQNQHAQRSILLACRLAWNQPAYGIAGKVTCSESTCLKNTTAGRISLLGTQHLSVDSSISVLYSTAESQIDTSHGSCSTVTYPTQKTFTTSALRVQIKGFHARRLQCDSKS